MVAILGLLGGMATLRWSDQALASAAAQGFARKLSMTLHVARRQTICEGTNAAVVFNRTSGDVSSFSLVRATGGGDVATDEVTPVPSGVTVTTAVDRWEYDYTGSLSAPSGGGTITVTDGVGTWVLTVNAVTGRVSIVKS